MSRFLRCRAITALVLAAAFAQPVAAEPAPVSAALAPLDQAHTFAQVRRGDATATLLEQGAIGTGSAVLTGTGAGVVFQAPAPAVMREVMGAPDRAAQRVAIEGYLAGEAAKRIYLQPGSRVRHLSNHLGAIDIDVVAAKQP